MTRAGGFLSSLALLGLFLGAMGIAGWIEGGF